MDTQTLQLLLVLGIPFLGLTVCWIFLMSSMGKTTGELKHWITPDNLIKGVAIVFIVTSVLALAVLKIIEGAVVGTILSGIIGYTLGGRFNNKNDQ